MKQNELIKIINDSVEQANKSILKWTNSRYFLGSSSPRLEGFMGSIMMQNIMQHTQELCVIPELYLNNLSELTKEDIENDIERKGRLDLAIFNKKWQLMYPIEIKRERVDIHTRDKMRPGYIKDLVRLTEIQKQSPNMKAGILTVFIFEKSSKPEELEKKIKKAKQFWRRELTEYFLKSRVSGVDILPKFSQQLPQKWNYKDSNGKTTHYIATSLCIVVKSF